MSTPTPPILLTRRKLFLILAVFGLATGATGAVGGSAAWASGQIFSDVPPSHPFFNEIQWAGRANIVNGYPDGTFRPTNTGTRQAALAFLANYNNNLDVINNTTNPGSNDVFTNTASCAPGWRALAGGGEHQRGQPLHHRQQSGNQGEQPGQLDGAMGIRQQRDHRSNGVDRVGAVRPAPQLSGPNRHRIEIPARA